MLGDVYDELPDVPRIDGAYENPPGRSDLDGGCCIGKMRGFLLLEGERRSPDIASPDDGGRWCPERG